VSQAYGEREGSRVGSLMTLAPAQKMKDITFKMVATAVITGRVLDGEGEPVPGASVEAISEKGGIIQQMMNPGRDAQTDDRGEYRIHGLSPGTYTVRATSQNEESFYARAISSRAGELEPARQTTYYPAAFEESQAARLELKAGQELTGIDIRLLETPGITVQGRVTLAVAGKTSSQTMVTLMDAKFRRGGMERMARVAEDGTFQLKNVAPGEYILMAMAMDMSDPMNPLRTQKRLEVGTADIDVDMVIGAGAEVKGRIVFEAMTPPELGRMMVYLRGEDFESMLGGGFAQVKKEEERFTFTAGPLQAGRYHAGVHGLPEGAYLSEVRVGGRDMSRTGMEIAGLSLGDVELIVRADGGTVEGQVLDKENLPASGVYVFLSDEEKTHGGYGSSEPAATDQLGRFTIRGVRPGNYRVFALAQPDEDEMRTHEFLKEHEKKGVAVRVERSGKHTVEVKLLEEKN